jgi:head-tail adaptor
MITASNLIHRVKILTPRIARDEYGAQLVSYVVTRTVKAHVRFQRGRHALEHGEYWLPNTIQVTTRLHPDLTESCRLMWDGKVYQMDSFNRDPFDGSITIVASRVDEGNATPVEVQGDFSSDFNDDFSNENGSGPVTSGDFNDDFNDDFSVSA